MEIENRVAVYASEIYARHIPGRDTRTIGGVLSMLELRYRVREMFLAIISHAQLPREEESAKKLRAKYLLVTISRIFYVGYTLSE